MNWSSDDIVAELRKSLTRNDLSAFDKELFVSSIKIISDLMVVAETEAGKGSNLARKCLIRWLP